MIDPVLIEVLRRLYENTQKILDNQDRMLAILQKWIEQETDSAAIRQQTLAPLIQNIVNARSGGVDVSGGEVTTERDIVGGDSK